jgi:hypothetical protein
VSKLQFLRAGVVATTMLVTPALAHENQVRSQHRAENATVSTALGGRHNDYSCIPALLVSVGYAGQAPPFHKGPWPIRNGHNYQPTENELRSLHLHDVTPDQAREIDRLYNQLLAQPTTTK